MYLKRTKAVTLGYIAMSALMLTLTCGASNCAQSLDTPECQATCGCWGCNNESTGDEASLSRDMTTQIATTESQQLENQGRAYATRFSLAAEQGMKIARTLHDFGALKNRSDADVADFAKRLYGVDPGRIMSAAGKASLGDTSDMNRLVGEAAGNFETSPENMKTIIKALHGQLLRQNGIDL